MFALLGKIFVLLIVAVIAFFLTVRFIDGRGYWSDAVLAAVIPMFGIAQLLPSVRRLWSA